MGLKSYASVWKQSLNQENKDKRLRGAKNLLNLLKNKPKQAVVMCSDEAYLQTYGFKNSTQNHIIAKKHEPLPEIIILKQQQRSPGLMIWVFLLHVRPISSPDLSKGSQDQLRQLPRTPENPHQMAGQILQS